MKFPYLQPLAISLLFVLLLISILASSHLPQAIGSLQVGILSSGNRTTDTPSLGEQTMIFQDGVSPDSSYAGTTDVILASDVKQNANLGGTENRLSELLWGKCGKYSKWQIASGKWQVR